jgi:hypothetical protein
MKRILLLMAMVLLTASQAFGAWTLKIVDQGTRMDGHIFNFDIICTSDGSAMSATDIFGKTAGVFNVSDMTEEFKHKIQRSMPMTMRVVPGTGGVVPDTTIDITLYDADGNIDYYKDALPATYNYDTSNVSLHTYKKQYLTVGEKRYIAISDIGSVGDQVTLKFECWIEDK